MTTDRTADHRNHCICFRRIIATSLVVSLGMLISTTGVNADTKVDMPPPPPIKVTPPPSAGTTATTATVVPVTDVGDLALHRYATGRSRPYHRYDTSDNRNRTYMGNYWGSGYYYGRNVWWGWPRYGWGWGWPTINVSGGSGGDE